MRPVVILDNGHGVETPGKRSPVWADGSQLREYEFNRDIVSRIIDMLETDGIEYVDLVPEEYDVSLRERCERANRIYRNYGGNAFLISIHANAGGGTGFELYTSYGQTQSDKIASIIAEEYKAEFRSEFPLRKDTTDGDVDKESNFYILRQTTGPAVLTENFFMDTEKDCKLILSEEGRERIARFHYKAIKRIIVS